MDVWGKFKNCQVGVFLGYTNGPYRTLIDEAFYLPREWEEDSKHLLKCGVPKYVFFKTKAELALEMILKSRDNGVSFGWIGMDCFYKEQSWLGDKINA